MIAKNGIVKPFTLSSWDFEVDSFFIFGDFLIGSNSGLVFILFHHYLVLIGWDVLVVIFSELIFLFKIDPLYIIKN